MDSFELNKIAGAVLGTFLFLMGIGMVSDVIFSPRKPGVPGYELPGDAAVAQTSAPAAPAVPLPELLAKGDVARGENAAKKCVACHAFEKGGPNKVGPNLWDIVGRTKGAVAGFGYSNATKERNAKGETWSFEALAGFIENPRRYMPGTSMAFAGIPKPEERADILVYLRSLADTPKPLPQ